MRRAAERDGRKAAKKREKFRSRERKVDRERKRGRSEFSDYLGVNPVLISLYESLLELTAFRREG